MKIRPSSAILTALLIGACSGDGGDASEASAEPAMSPDETAIAELAESWATHYNLGHASVVAAYYADDAWSLSADLTNLNGREAIEADMAAAMEASSPQAELTPGESMLFGDQAVAWGSYSVESTTPDGAITTAGTYMNLLTKVDGEWKIQVNIANFDAAPPEGFEYGESGETPDNDGTMGDLVASYETHWNLGHPSMVADLYASDAMVAFADLPVEEGREAIASLLSERMEATPTDVTINDVGTIDLAEGWVLDGGWYQMAAKDDGPVVRTGMYLLLVNQTDDGWSIKWGLTNGRPADGM